MVKLTTCFKIFVKFLAHAVIKLLIKSNLITALDLNAGVKKSLHLTLKTLNYKVMLAQC